MIRGGRRSSRSDGSINKTKILVARAVVLYFQFYNGGFWERRHIKKKYEVHKEMVASLKSYSRAVSSPWCFLRQEAVLWTQLSDSLCARSSTCHSRALASLTGFVRSNTSSCSVGWYRGGAPVKKETIHMQTQELKTLFVFKDFLKNHLLSAAFWVQFL